MNLSDTEQIKAHFKQSAAALIYFYSDRCSPCISLRPKVEKLLQESFPEMKLIYVDSEKQPEIAAYFGVFSNPTLLLYFDGHEHQRLSKYVSIAQLSEAIDRPYHLLLD
ncbi:MAG: thioredoxin family protein [Bacteroidetes bacterium]|jgi:thioredoxin 1|nr:thioredoxin family protein [Bacteroidota bacterium]